MRSGSIANYDGAGGRFGETGVQAVSSDQTQLAMYGAVRASDGALTLVVINKTAASLTAALSLGNFTANGPASVYQYSGTNLIHIAAEGSVGLLGSVLGYTFPAYSATVLVMTRR